MIYIKLIENEENSKINLFNRISSKFDNLFPKIEEKKINDKTLIVLYNTNRKTLSRLSKYISINCICKVCLSENLLNNQEFVKYILNENVKIFDGKWLFKYLISDCASYISLCKKEILDYQEISILCNNPNDIVFNDIRELAVKIRVLNIITNNEKRFKKLEKELYEKKGIILNISNNYTKSLKKSDIIFNFDFSEDDINKFTFSKNACIINLKDEIKINLKSFEGINANFYSIQMPNKYLVDTTLLSEFNPTILYESYIYKNTSYQNIINEIKKDNITIEFLYGRNGKIRKNEYLKLSKKIAN